MSDLPQDQPQDQILQDAPLRRKPSQTRALEKIQLICDVAIKLIAEKGSDTLRMSEIAQKAGISIGALYQYFPDKSALIGYLFGIYARESRNCISSALEKITTADALLTAYDDLIEEYYALFLSEPAIADIWSATQTDKALLQLEITESRANGNLLAQTVIKLRTTPHSDAVQLHEQTFLLLHFCEATMRHALQQPESHRKSLVDAYKTIAQKTLHDLLYNA